MFKFSWLDEQFLGFYNYPAAAALYLSEGVGSSLPKSLPIMCFFRRLKAEGLLDFLTELVQSFIGIFR